VGPARLGRHPPSAVTDRFSGRSDDVAEKDDGQWTDWTSMRCLKAGQIAFRDYQPISRAILDRWCHGSVYHCRSPRRLAEDAPLTGKRPHLQHLEAEDIICVGSWSGTLRSYPAGGRLGMSGLNKNDQRPLSRSPTDQQKTFLEGWQQNRACHVEICGE
jgi:hypothetical protein